MKRQVAKFCRNLLILAGFTMTVSACYGPPLRDPDEYNQQYNAEEEGPQVKQNGEEAEIEMNDADASGSAAENNAK